LLFHLNHPALANTSRADRSLGAHFDEQNRNAAAFVGTQKQTQRNILHLGSASRYVTLRLERIKKPPPASP
jgi:hypothetical protein